MLIVDKILCLNCVVWQINGEPSLWQYFPLVIIKRSYHISNVTIEISSTSIFKSVVFFIYCQIGATVTDNNSGQKLVDTRVSSSQKNYRYIN